MFAAVFFFIWGVYHAYMGSVILRQKHYTHVRHIGFRLKKQELFRENSLVIAIYGSSFVFSSIMCVILSVWVIQVDFLTAIWWGLIWVWAIRLFGYLLAEAAHYHLNRHKIRQIETK